MMDYSKIYPFWSNLTTTEQDTVARSCIIEKFPKGTQMPHCQENCKGLMSVLTGSLRVYIVSEEGREVTLFRVFAGDVCVLSASCLMDAIVFEVQIEAEEETEVLTLPSYSLNGLMKNNPYVELYLYKAATEKFSEVMWTMQQILFLKIDQRVAAFLWDEFARTGQTTLSMTHDEIARYIGSAREVVTKVLKYLASNGVIELKRGKIIICDKEKLKNWY